MSYLLEDGVKVRFNLEFSNLRQYIELDEEEKSNSDIHKIFDATNQLSEQEILCVLFAGKLVIKNIRDSFYNKVGEDYTRKLALLNFLVNSADDEGSTDLSTSLWKTTSKVGYENYLITSRKSLKEKLEKEGVNFKIITPAQAYEKIIKLAKEMHKPIVA